MLTTVLVADDKKSMREFLSEALQKEGYQVSLAADGEQALELFRELIPDIVITDIRMPGLNGLEFLKSMRDLDPEAVVIVITAYGSIETAVTAMKSGAYDYITKPFSIDELTVVMDKAKEQRRLVDENRRLRLELTKKYKFENIIGKSPKIQEVFDIMERVIPSKATVMLYGESGTGKELIARAIHYSGARKNGPFVKVNCAALPESLLESELFGHERGAFTGAIQRRQGRFELSDNGSIFLDEIGDISPTVQVRLLRVIQQREFERVGGAKTIQVDVRILAATNRDLEEAVEDGVFRKDLYFRLHVLHIDMPPLRQRREDIPLLIKYHLDLFNAENGKNVTGVAPEALDTLTTYDWPGNVRELRNCVERMIVMTQDSTLTIADVPHEIRDAAGTVLVPVTTLPTASVLDMETNERNLIVQALRNCNGNRSAAARELGISRRTLHRKINQFNLRDL